MMAVQLFTRFQKENSAAYTCCFLCHVRTGTIFWGIFCLLMQLIVLASVAVMFFHPEVLPVPDMVMVIAPEADSNDSLNWIARQQTNSEDMFFSILMIGGMISITAMLIYGAIKRRPGYLMPYFCIQVFQFCITCLSGVSYFSYIPNMKRWIELQPDFPYRERLLAMDSDWLMLLFVLGFALVLMMEAYLIGMVWGCYKYLVQREMNGTNGTLPVRTFPTERAAHNDDASEMLLPPKYEDAILQSASEPPPPPYSQGDQ